MSRSSEGQGHYAECIDLSNNVCEYEVNQLTNEKVIRGKRNFNANFLPKIPLIKWIFTKRFIY